MISEKTQPPCDHSSISSKMFRLLTICCVASLLYRVSRADQCDGSVLFDSIDEKTESSRLNEFKQYVDKINNPKVCAVGMKLAQVYDAFNARDRRCVDGWTSVFVLLQNEFVSEGTIELWYGNQNSAYSEQHRLVKPELVLIGRMYDFLASLEAQDDRWTCLVWVQPREDGVRIQLHNHSNLDVVYNFRLPFDS
jgi:hypothetical protein